MDISETSQSMHHAVCIPAGASDSLRGRQRGVVSDELTIDDRITASEERQWLKWFCEAGGGGGGSPDEARLEQTPYPFQLHYFGVI